MFTGFSNETITFFTALGFNNNRTFFEENRDMYERAVRKPLLALAEALIPTVREMDPLLDTRPERAVSRIYRDVRFSKDKSPYRDHMWIGYRRVGEPREEACCLYFSISAQATSFGCGYYHAKQSYMQRLREMIVNHPERVAGILQDEAFCGMFSLMGENYARQYKPPEGLPSPLADLYQKKDVYAEHHVADVEMLYSPVLAERIGEGFRVLAPFYTLLREAMMW